MFLSSFDLTGRVAIITGGGTGIGAAIAAVMAQLGADIVLAGRRPDPLEKTAKAIHAESGRHVLSVPTDVRDASQVTQLIDRTVSELGRLDILINNAGKASQAPLRSMSAERWNQDIALNLNAAFLCSQTARPHLKASGHGAIVNISSLAGVNGTIGVGAYAAAKSGLQMFSRVAAAEWGPHIRVNAVACGMIATDLAKAGWEKVGFDAMGACKAFPLRRPGTPEEVARAVVFLASDAASYITGETLTVAGGPQLKGMIDVEE